MAVDMREATRALNGWARSQGYSDFDTYIASGGSIGDAVTDINRRRQRLDLAMAALYAWQAPSASEQRELDPAVVTSAELLDEHERANARMAIGPDALARVEAEVIGDEPVDPDNAHVQGADDEDRA